MSDHRKEISGQLRTGNPTGSGLTETRKEHGPSSLLFTNDHLAMRATGMAKACDEMEPGAREFCLAALGDLVDELGARGDLIDRLRAERLSIAVQTAERIDAYERELAAARADRDRLVKAGDALADVMPLEIRNLQPRVHPAVIAWREVSGAGSQ